MCKLVSGMYKFVSDACKLVSGMCKLIRDVCKLGSGVYQLTHSSCRVVWTRNLKFQPCRYRYLHGSSLTVLQMNLIKDDCFIVFKYLLHM